MTISRGQLKSGLESLGMSYGQFDIFCELERGTTQNVLKRGSHSPVTPAMEEKLNMLGDEQEQMGLLAVDKVYKGRKEGSENLIFVPHFQTIKTYSRSGYMRSYGTYLHFLADSRYIFERLRFVDQNILSFTPANTHYQDEDVFAGFDANANRVIVDPLRLRKELNLHLGPYKLSAEKMNERIGEESQAIQDAVIAEIAEYTSLNGGKPPRLVYIPRYLNAKDFMARRVKEKLDVRVYNQAATDAIEELDAKAKEFEEGYRVMGCDPKDLCEPRVDVLKVDVLGLIYGGEWR